jgi:hypothetical protein
LLFKTEAGLFETEAGFSITGAVDNNADSSAINKKAGSRNHLRMCT